ncbi:hypothetical protein [Nonomuraea basaltis]|uniref:hypothetical protein n=1 Tax=Nonomuraea basaltis TaxID=2495887 RepID=UPI00110C60C8|nr:hypothetical protein [Nonomuraea basaltis]TMR89928.1 hypothetical protein EJK15_58095 [Nonomuraea basaltis]
MATSPSHADAVDDLGLPVFTGADSYSKAGGRLQPAQATVYVRATDAVTITSIAEEAVTTVAAKATVTVE